MAFPKGQKQGELSPKQICFIENYTNQKSETFGNATKSYIKAGYKNTPAARVAAARLLSNPSICSALIKQGPESREITLIKREITGAYADNATVDTYERAVAARDITNQVACCRILQQRCGQLSDRLVVDVEDSRRLDDSHRAQAKRLALFMVNHGLLTQPGQVLIPASFEPVIEQIQVQDVVRSDNQTQAIITEGVDDDTQVVDNQ